MYPELVNVNGSCQSPHFSYTFEVRGEEMGAWVGVFLCRCVRRCTSWWFLLLVASGALLLLWRAPAELGALTRGDRRAAAGEQAAVAAAAGDDGADCLELMHQHCVRRGSQLLHLRRCTF